MGPPLFSGGNIGNILVYAVEGKLQWGRRFSAAEMAKAQNSYNAELQLQWGRRFSAAEMSPATNGAVR